MSWANKHQSSSNPLARRSYDQLPAWQRQANTPNNRTAATSTNNGGTARNAPSSPRPARRLPEETARLVAAAKALRPSSSSSSATPSRPAASASSLTVPASLLVNTNAISSSVRRSASSPLPRSPHPASAVPSSSSTSSAVSSSTGRHTLSSSASSSSCTTSLSLSTSLPSLPFMRGLPLASVASLPLYIPTLPSAATSAVTTAKRRRMNNVLDGPLGDTRGRRSSDINNDSSDDSDSDDAISSKEKKPTKKSRLSDDSVRDRVRTSLSTSIDNAVKASLPAAAVATPTSSLIPASAETASSLSLSSSSAAASDTASAVDTDNKSQPNNAMPTVTPSVVDGRTIINIASDIEEELYRSCGISDVYRSRTRLLLLNLRDPTNTQLGVSVAYGTITPLHLTQLSVEDLASAATRAERQQLRREAIEAATAATRTRFPSRDYMCPQCSCMDTEYSLLTNLRAGVAKCDTWGHKDTPDAVMEVVCTRCTHSWTREA